MRLRIRSLISLVIGVFTIGRAFDDGRSYRLSSDDLWCLLNDETSDFIWLSPRMKIVHTSSKEIGQIYIPVVNWLQLAAVVGAVLGFGSAGNLASARWPTRAPCW